MIEAMFASALMLSTAAIGEVEGLWRTEDETAIIRLLPCDGDMSRLCGDLVWVIDDEGLDEGYLGGRILEDFTYEDGAFRQGRLINPEDGRVYRGAITVQGDDQLDLQGCALRVFCQTRTWSRYDGPLPTDVGVTAPSAAR